MPPQYHVILGAPVYAPPPPPPNLATTNFPQSFTQTSNDVPAGIYRCIDRHRKVKVVDVQPVKVSTMLTWRRKQTWPLFKSASVDWGVTVLFVAPTELKCEPRPWRGLEDSVGMRWRGDIKTQTQCGVVTGPGGAQGIAELPAVAESQINFSWMHLVIARSWWAERSPCARWERLLSPAGSDNYLKLFKPFDSGTVCLVTCHFKRNVNLYQGEERNSSFRWLKAEFIDIITFTL